MTEATADGSTDSSDYAATYYVDGHLGPPYTYDEPHWRDFFGRVADAVIATFGPGTVYDAGCAIGLFVRALMERGVEAYGGDVSEFAIAGAPPGLRERLEVHDLTRPFDRRYDLISAIEVLEHMSPVDTQAAIANICEATDTVLLSSTPEDYTEPTHVNVRTPASWAQDFARHGFFRRTDVDASFLSPWAVVFSRQEPTVIDLVSRYETLLYPLSREVTAKRQALLDVQRDLDQHRSASEDDRQELRAQVARLTEERDKTRASLDRLMVDRDRLQDDLIKLRGSGEPSEQLVRLALVDELIGVKAELVQARIRADNAVVDASQENREVAEELQRIQEDLQQVRQSYTWRIGRAGMLPVRVARRLRQR